MTGRNRRMWPRPRRLAALAVALAFGAIVLGGGAHDREPAAADAYARAAIDRRLPAWTPDGRLEPLRPGLGLVPAGLACTRWRPPVTGGNENRDAPQRTGPDFACLVGLADRVGALHRAPVLLRWVGDDTAPEGFALEAARGAARAALEDDRPLVAALDRAR